MHKLSHWWFCDASKLWHCNAEVRSVEWWLDLPLDHSSWKPGGREHLRLPAAWHGTSQDLSNPLRNRKAWCIMLKTACIHPSFILIISDPLSFLHVFIYILVSTFSSSFLASFYNLTRSPAQGLEKHRGSHWGSQSWTLLALQQRTRGFWSCGAEVFQVSRLRTKTWHDMTSHIWLGMQR